MNSFHALVAECEYNELILAEFRAATRNALLERICMFGGDPVFQSIAAELARAIDATIETATAKLWPECHALYEAAAKLPLATNTKPASDSNVNHGLHLDNRSDSLTRRSNDGGLSGGGDWFGISERGGR